MVPKLFKKYFYEKCNCSTFPMSKTITQIRLHDRIKCERKSQHQGSNFGTYNTYTHLMFKISDFIIAASFKIKVFQMLMATTFLQDDVFVLNLNLPYSLVIGIVTSDAFCGSIFSGHTFSFFSVF